MPHPKAVRGHPPAAGRARRIDLGLALLSCLLLPGECLSSEDLAAWCGCSRRTIQRIEQRALAKVRQRLTDRRGWRS